MRDSMVRLLEEYEAYHTHPINRLTHKVAIPLIMFHVVAMLDWVRLGGLEVAGHPVALAHGLLLPVAGWYLWMAPRLAPLVLLPLLVCLPLGRATSQWLVVLLAVVAWIIQLAGHVVWEKRSPAFVTNLLQLLVGPVFFVAVAVGAWPRSEEV